jgi:hypothetical protein
MTTPNPFIRFLDDEPEAAYFARREEFGGSPRQKQFFEGDYANIYNQYLGFLGNQAKAGQMPSGSFNDFFQNLLPNSAAFDQQFRELTPNQRGVRSPASLQWSLPR